MITTHHIHQSRFFTILAAAILRVTLASMHAHTYTWDQQALGQEYLTCISPGYPDAHYYYPSNSYWSQFEQGPRLDDGLNPGQQFA